MSSEVETSLETSECRDATGKSVRDSSSLHIELRLTTRFRSESQKRAEGYNLPTAPQHFCTCSGYQGNTARCDRLRKLNAESAKPIHNPKASLNYLVAEYRKSGKGYRQNMKTTMLKPL